MTMSAENPGMDPAFEFVKALASDLADGDFELPPFPDTAIRVQRCVADPNSDIKALASIVAQEPALAARLMRMANSALLKRGTLEVTDIPTAISRVGMDMVLNAAVAFAAKEAMRPPPGSACISAVEPLRRRSIQVAVIGFVLSRRLQTLGKPEEAMLAGLLHAVGQLYVYTRAAEHPELFSDREAIDALVQDWHTGVARAIVEAWGFPESIARAVCEQETQERDRKSDPELGDLLFVAIAVATSEGDLTERLEGCDPLARMGLSLEELEAMLAEQASVIENMVSNLGG
ncbi:MAG: HDOD domain-containing protein [Pseudomonadales bacterium]|jgi:HD-like signal output (HDOD) protein|nr:HDOD domain-containing protein [Pseudomonadales bacterium]